MGCAGSKNAKSDDFTNLKAAEEEAPAPANIKNTAAASKPKAAGQPSKAAAPPPKLDPKDFQFVNCKDGCNIKLPGTINGQAFIIDKCENCDIYVLDWCAQVTIDDCKGCRIFIGPTDGAVFIRDCSDCSFAIVSRQIRTRGCNGCNLSIYCRTKPIVEASTNMLFGCMDLRYPQLKEHMQAAKLSPFHNFWSDIFDFTPKDGNFSLLDPGVTTRSLMEPLPAEAAEVLDPQAPAQDGEAAQAPVLLTTWGSRRARPEGRSYLFVAFPGAKQEQALSFAATAAEKGWLLHTNEARLSGEVAAALAAEAGWAKSVAKALSAGAAGCVGLELAVPPEEAAATQGRVTQLGAHCSDSELPGKTFRTVGLSG